MNRFRAQSPLIMLLLLAGAALLLWPLLGCGDITAETTTKTVSSITIAPTSASLEAGKSVSFSCTANYSDGSGGAVKPTWTLSGEVGTLTTVSYSCTLRASREGTGTINAAYNGFNVSARVTVTPEAALALTTIEVTPATYTGRLTGRVNFSAVGKTASGETKVIAPRWTLSGDPVGTLTASGNSATLEIKAEGLATIKCTSGKVAGYAYVTIEGFVVEITVEADTYVDEAIPSPTHGSDPSLKAGYINATAKHYETYLRFPLTALPAGASIETAVLRLYPSSAGSATLQLKRLDSAFTNATTWETRPTVSTFLLSGTFSPGAYNELSGAALITLVRGWYGGTATNFGLAIVQEGTNDGTAVLLSLDNGTNFPLLRLEYTKP